MTPDDLSPDRELANALRAFDRTPVYAPAASRALSQRIAAHADPFLIGRQAVRRVPWWMFAAEWARALIPIGATTALVAAAFIIWSAYTPRAARRAPPRRDALAQTLLNSLVTSIDESVATARRETR